MRIKQALTKFGDELPAGSRYFRLDKITSEANPDSAVTLKCGTYIGQCKTTQEGMRRLEFANRIVPSKIILNYVRYIEDFPAIARSNCWDDIGGI